MDQFIEGLKMAGLKENIQESPRSMKALFVFCATGVTVAEFRSLVNPAYSPSGSNKRDEEEQTIIWWHDYLDDLECDNSSSGLTTTVEDLLVFITGAHKIPPCGFDQELQILFYHAYEGTACRLPYASTCSMVLYLPLGLGSYDKFKEVLQRSLKEFGGFGCI